MKKEEYIEKYKQACDFYNCAKFQSAISIYEELYSVTPKNYNLLVNYANALDAISKREEAIKYYRLATKIDPKRQLHGAI